MPRRSRPAARAAAGLVWVALALAGCGDSTPVLPVTAAYTDLGAQVYDLVRGLTPRSLWVSGFDQDQVFEVDASTRAVLRTLRVRSGPADIIADPARHALYVLHLKENALSIIGGDPPAVERSLGTGDISLASGRLRPGADELWVCDGLSKLHVLVPKGMQLKFEWPVGRYPQKLAFTPDGRYVWVTLKGENCVVVLDAGTHQEIARVPTGIYPLDLLVVGTTVCVSNYGSHDVSLLDLTQRVERARVKVRRNPNALSARGGTLWVACEDSYRLMAIDVAKAQLIGSVKTGFYPGAVLALDDGSLVVSDRRHHRLAFLTPTAAVPEPR